ncbi:MAG: redoxin domain-containing protein [Acidimicrobiia bacterium]|nr:redoxin domain-containing protein [Acidimicrobiia bacterium]
MGASTLDDRGVRVSCPACGTRNRLVWARLGLATRCGRCRTPLAQPAEPLDVPSAEVFDVLTRESRLPVVVDFWAPWCGPCRMVAPELARMAHTVAGGLLVVKVNTDALAELGERHRVRSIPMMAVFGRGRELARAAGARPAAEIERFAREAVATIL